MNMKKKSRQEKNINEPAGVTRKLAPLGVSETQYTQRSRDVCEYELRSH